DCTSICKLNEYFGKKVITEIKPSNVADYKTHRLGENSYRKHGTRPATINRELACMRHMFNLAIREGKYDKNPVKGVRFEKENNKRDRFLSEDEFQRLLKKSPDYLKSILMTGYHSGMRKSEILHLQWDRLDLKSGFIR